MPIQLVDNALDALLREREAERQARLVQEVATARAEAWRGFCDLMARNTGAAQEVAMSEEAKPIVEVLDRQTGEITTVGARPMLMGVRLRINYDHSVYQAVRKIAGEPVTLEGCGDQKFHYTTGAGRRFTATVKMGR